MNLKRIIITIVSSLTFLLSTISLAGGPDLAPLPPPKAYFIFGVGGNFWQPSDSELTWAAETGPNRNSFLRYFTLQPNYDWGVNAKIGYLSPDKITAFYLLYHYVDSSTSRSAATSLGTNNVLLPIPPTMGNLNLFGISSGFITAEYYFHHIEALADHVVWQTHHFSVRVLGGLGYAYNRRVIRQLFQGFFSNTESEGTERTEFINSFWAFGPEAGARVNFHIARGLALYSQFIGGVYAGNIDETFSFLARDNQGGVAPITGRLTATREGQVIPMLSAEAGATWSWLIGDLGRSFDVTVAYRFISFLNSYNGRFSFLNPFRENSNMSYHGLVFRLGMTV